MKRKECIYYVVIVAFAIGLISLFHSPDSLFGSSIDYLSQHVEIADTLRTTIYKQGFFPNYVDSLGGGQNVYNFAYYGLFRFDVIIALILPMIDMYTIIVLYMLTCFILSLCLFFKLLRNNRVEPLIAFVCVCLLALSSFVFQIHRQIMFVNYMPWLILCLLIVNQKKKLYLFISCFLMIILHSFFFSVSCGLVVFLFYLYKNQGQITIKRIFTFVVAIAIAYGISSIYLLPTGLAILGNSRSADTSKVGLELYDFSFKNMLYHKYGMGLTMLPMITLWIGLKDKAIRCISILVILCCCIPFVCYVLNFTLYTRGKIMMPFIPLLLFICAIVIQKLYRQEIKLKYYDVALIVWILFLNDFHTLIVFDVILSVCILGLILYKSKKIGICIAIGVAFFVSLRSNQSEVYVKKRTYETLQHFQEDKVLERLELDDYRIEDIRFKSNAVNVSSFSSKKTSVYTSINHTKYNQFFYDVIKNAMPSRNRVTTNYQQHPVFAQLMGIRYIYTNKKSIPIGYKAMEQNEERTILENKDVLPIAYTTSKIMDEDLFNQLSFPAKLSALQEYTLTQNGKKTEFVPKYAVLDFPTEITKIEEGLVVGMKKDEIQIHANTQSKMQLRFNQRIEDIVVLQFDVKDISNIKHTNLKITINGLLNQLSSNKAPYPNHNTTFTYVLSDSKGIKHLNFTLSKGEYTLENIKMYRLPYTIKKVQEINQVKTKPTTSVLRGDVELKEDGYFITSLPIQEGYVAYVNGEKTKIETVNNVFVGFPLNAGTYEIEIAFHPPGKTIGFIASGVGVLFYILYIICERKHDEKK